MSKYKSIVVLTGAGISAESGIKTFRDSQGLWEDHPIEDVASPAGFARDPTLVHAFYNQRRRQLLSPGLRENAAHRALGRLEQAFTGEFLLVTQNIDDLHERGGSRNIVHMHGEILKQRCVHCRSVHEVRGDLAISDVCPSCQTMGTLRPHIVWFGEIPFQMDKIETAVQRCDLFLSIGTSGSVYPAAGLVRLANQFGAMTMETNLEPSAQGSSFRKAVYGRATEIVPRLVDQLLDGNA